MHCVGVRAAEFSRGVEAEPNYPQCTEALTLSGELLGIDRDTADRSELEGAAKLQAAEARPAAWQDKLTPIN